MKDAISEMVVSGLSAPATTVAPTPSTTLNSKPTVGDEEAETTDYAVDPVNPKIVKNMLSGVINEEEKAGQRKQGRSSASVKLFHIPYQLKGYI